MQIEFETKSLATWTARGMLIEKNALVMEMQTQELA